MTHKPNINKTYSDTVGRRPAGNSGLAKVAVQYSADTFVVNQTFVLRINICGKNRHLRQAANRCKQFFLDILIQHLSNNFHSVKIKTEKRNTQLWKVFSK